MYAIIKAGGKQYRVQEGDIIYVEKMNAEVDALVNFDVLLCGEGDFGRSICLAVQSAFDTDCNGATVGSIIGIRNGYSGIGDVWTAPTRGKLATSIFGVGILDIDKAVERTMKHIAGDLDNED